ncbi:shugoshin c isoform 2 [Lasius niger]|uniref:Shugoshin c isoform 2 n=1 Tax=Lasius niger TaxID=67767 RepID=A0A0J7KWX7_LASNI|nr:shugoshin c isoform 2 [Lasius niger]
MGNDRRIVYNQDIHSAIITVMEHVDSLFSVADKLEHGRNYLLSRLREWERHTAVHAHGLNQGPPNEGLCSSPIVMTQGGDFRMLDISSQLSLYGCHFSPPSVLRGDDLEITRANLSRLGTTLGPPSVRGSRVVANQELIARIESVQERIDSINHEIATKNASLQLLDAAAGTALDKLVSEVSFETEQRVGRARRRGEASRPRGGPPRTRSPNYKDNMADTKERVNVTATGDSDPQWQARESYGPWGSPVSIERRACPSVADGRRV